MTRFALLLITAVPTLAHADWFVATPRAVAPLPGQVTMDALYRKGTDARYRLGYGIGNGFSAAVTHGPGGRTSGDVAYNYIPAISDYTPGLSIGVLDVADEFEVTGYLAVTMRFGNYGMLNQDRSTEVTFGYWTRDGGQAFVNATFPFSTQIALIAEYDGTPRGGFQWAWDPNLVFRAMTDRQGPLLGITARYQF